MKLHEQINLQTDIEVPWGVWRYFGDKAKTIALAGDSASLAEDFGDLDQLRTAIAWYVDQLGGKVKWKK